MLGRIFENFLNWLKITLPFRSDETHDENNFRVKMYKPTSPYHLSSRKHRIELTITNQSNLTTHETRLCIIQNDIYFRSWVDVPSLKPGQETRCCLQADLKGQPTVMNIPALIQFEIQSEPTSFQTCLSNYTGDLKLSKPSSKDCGGKYKILLFGVAGSGKSSFINGINTLFSRDNKVQFDCARAGGATDHCTTELVYHDISSDKELPFQLVDTWGLDLETYQDLALEKLCKGELPRKGFTMTHNVASLSRGASASRALVTTGERIIHTVLFFVRNGDLGNDDLMAAIEEKVSRLGDAGYNPWIIVSRIDEVDGNALKNQTWKVIDLIFPLSFSHHLLAP